MSSEIRSFKSLFDVEGDVEDEGKVDVVDVDVVVVVDAVVDVDVDVDVVVDVDEDEEIEVTPDSMFWISSF